MRKLLKKFIKLFISFVIIFLIGNIGIYIYCLCTPKLSISRNQSFYLYNSDEEIIYNNYSWIELKDINKNLINATIATEDKHFYEHYGFDYLRIAKAIINNINSKSLSEGGSTITQQYAKVLFLDYEKTWKRKIKEAILTFELETHYTKDEILEGYLNTINYGGVYGIENASNYYFGKSASDLDLAEATMLAGIPQSPSNYSPLNNLDLAKKRQKVVLKLMYDNNVISEEEKNNAFDEELTYIGKSYNDITSGILYYKDAVLKELDNIDSISSNILKMGGIKIYTSLDNKAQGELEKAVDSKDTDELQISSIMMNPNNGEIIALIGGTDYYTSQFNRAISSKRQVGSTMKPFLYYAALESGFTSASSFISEKTTFSFSDNKTYTPKNYNDRYANGPLSMGAAIAYSDNIYAVKTHLFLGEENLVSIANRLGISNKLSPVPSLPLGTEEISMLEMVSAYSSFANMGKKVEGHTIRKIEDANGNILYEYKDSSIDILNESLVYILNEMLTYTYDKDFIDYNYPTLISLLPQITNKYSIKSGTTNTDMWIIGYNKDVVLGVWAGYDDNKYFTSKDANIHKSIWIETIEGYLEDKNSQWYDVPNNIIGVMVDPITGKISTDSKKAKLFYFIKGTQPMQNNDYDVEEVFKNENYNKEDDDGIEN